MIPRLTNFPASSGVSGGGGVSGVNSGVPGPHC